MATQLSASARAPSEVGSGEGVAATGPALSMTGTLGSVLEPKAQAWNG